MVGDQPEVDEALAREVRDLALRRTIARRAKDPLPAIARTWSRTPALVEYRKDWEARYMKLLVYGRPDIDLAVVAADAAYAHVAGEERPLLPPWADVPTFREQFTEERERRIREYRRSAIVRDYRSHGRFPTAEGPLAPEMRQGILDACAYLQIDPVVPPQLQAVPQRSPGTASLPPPSPARLAEQRPAPATKAPPAGRPSISGHAVPAVSAAVMLMVAVGDLPSGYYSWLRWVVSVSAIATAVISDRGGRSPIATLTFIVIALVWNPLLPVYLTREAWLPLDLLAAGVMAWGATLRSKPPAP